MDRHTDWHFVWSASPVILNCSNIIVWNEWGIPDHDMKQTNQTTTLPTIDLPRHRFGEYNFVNLGTAGHRTDRHQTDSRHPYKQDHVLSCSATKNTQKTLFVIFFAIVGLFTNKEKDDISTKNLIIFVHKIPVICFEDSWTNSSGSLWYMKLSLFKNLTLSNKIWPFLYK